MGDQDPRLGPQSRRMKVYEHRRSRRSRRVALSALLLQQHSKCRGLKLIGYSPRSIRWREAPFLSRSQLTSAHLTVPACQSVSQSSSSMSISPFLRRPLFPTVVTTRQCPGQLGGHPGLNDLGRGGLSRGGLGCPTTAGELTHSVLNAQPAYDATTSIGGRVLRSNSLLFHGREGGARHIVDTVFAKTSWRMGGVCVGEMSEVWM